MSRSVPSTKKNKRRSRKGSHRRGAGSLAGTTRSLGSRVGHGRPAGSRKKKVTKERTDLKACPICHLSIAEKARVCPYCKSFVIV